MLLAVQNYESCISNINPIILGTNIIPFIHAPFYSVSLYESSFSHGGSGYWFWPRKKVEIGKREEGEV